MRCLNALYLAILSPFHAVWYSWISLYSLKLDKLSSKQTSLQSSKKTDVWQDFVCCEENLKFIQTRFCAFPDPMKRVLYFFFLHFQLYIHCIKRVEVIRNEKGLWRSSLRRATYWTMKQTNPVLSGFQAKFEYDVGWSLTKWSRFCFQRNFN